MRNFLLSVLSLAFAGGFSANCDAVTVKGMKRCDAWVKSHASKRTAPQARAAEDAWLLGYLSGVAVAKDIDFLKGVDDDTIQSWMIHYCRSHPSDLIGYAADALSIELVKRMH